MIGEDVAVGGRWRGRGGEWRGGNYVGMRCGRSIRVGMGREGGVGSAIWSQMGYYGGGGRYDSVSFLQEFVLGVGGSP